MTCREFVHFIDRDLEGDVTLRQRFCFRLHQILCPNCDHYLATYRQSLAAARRALAEQSDEAPAEVPTDLVRAILAARRDPPRQ